MNQLAADYAAATTGKAWRNVTLNGFTVLGIAASVASGLGAPAAGLDGAVLTACRFAADQWLDHPEKTPDRRAGAMVRNSRYWFVERKERAGKR